MFRYSIIVSGTVQGVGYRYFVLNKAISFDITGWVRNLDDGGVEISAEGEKALLDDFAGAIKSQHPWASIRSIEIAKAEIDERSSGSFTIIT